MNGFALLWGKILHSSIWINESKETRLVWITMLAMKNSKGEIFSSTVGLADAAKVSKDECLMALKVFLSPDADDTSGVDEGRRIRIIPGGWQIVNHDLYRFSTEAKREFWRTSKAEQREKKKPATIRQRIKEQLKADPNTKSDKAAMRKLTANGHATTRATKEYDLDESVGEEEKAAVEADIAADHQAQAG